MIVFNHLAFFLVPRPAFEIIKVGKMWEKEKRRKYSNITIYQSFTIILNFNPN